MHQDRESNAWGYVPSFSFDVDPNISVKSMLNQQWCFKLNQMDPGLLMRFIRPKQSVYDFHINIFFLNTKPPHTSACILHDCHVLPVRHIFTMTRFRHLWCENRRFPRRRWNKNRPGRAFLLLICCQLKYQSHWTALQKWCSQIR